MYLLNAQPGDLNALKSSTAAGDTQLSLCGFPFSWISCDLLSLCCVTSVCLGLIVITNSRSLCVSVLILTFSFFFLYMWGIWIIIIYTTFLYFFWMSQSFLFSSVSYYLLSLLRIVSPLFFSLVSSSPIFFSGDLNGYYFILFLYLFLHVFFLSFFLCILFPSLFFVLFLLFFLVNHLFPSISFSSSFS